MESVSTYSEGPRDPYREDVIPLLEDGWEPFAVQESVYFFKRLKPCETCKPINKGIAQDIVAQELATNAAYRRDMAEAGETIKSLI